MGAGAGRKSEEGFSLIELLVVITILAILVSISLPIYLNQRERAYISSIQSTLKNTAAFIDAYATTRGGNYEDLDGKSANIPELIDEGYQHPDWAQAPGFVRIEATSTRYCIEARHFALSTTDEWRDSTYDSFNPRPVEEPNLCPDL